MKLTLSEIVGTVMAFKRGYWRLFIWLLICAGGFYLYFGFVWPLVSAVGIGVYFLYRARRGGAAATLVLLPLLLSGPSFAGSKTASWQVDYGIPDLSEFTAVYVSISGSSEVQYHKKFPETAGGMSAMMLSELSGSFDRALAGSPETPGATNLLVHIHVEEFKYTGKGGRLMGGMAAGKAKLSLVVTLTGGDGAPVAEFSLFSKSKGKHGMFGGTTKPQSRKMAEEISRAVIERR